MRIVAAALIALTVGAAGCSASMSIDEYGAALEDRMGAFRTEHTELGETHLAGLDAAISELQRSIEGEALIEAAVEETANRSAQLFAAIGDALDRLDDELDGLSAPRNVATEHRSYVDALTNTREAVGPLLTDLSSATSFDEIDRALSGSHYADSLPRVEAACARLEEALAGHSVDVDLECGPTP